ncbi:MAG: SDR family NAD(P)-dependent oxidoreductase [Myxococcales bacterium]|nr:SDR family NAD(P)-dependent oxidoreductase [Myxococcales bacterium]
MTAPFRRALITGASSGLGRALALWFARQGVVVYAAARRAEQLQSLKAEAPEHIIPMVLDVSDADAAHDAVRALDASCGGLDLVIANAGIGDQMAAEAIEWSRIRKVLDVNVMGATATLVGALPGMVARKRGQLVGISSLAASVSLPQTAAYNSSKSFLTAWLESLRLDVEQHGVAVTVIHPGFVKSELTAKNTFQMPFLLETDDAAQRVGRAIMRQTRFFAFPWPMAFVVWLAGALPRPMLRFFARRTL